VDLEGKPAVQRDRGVLFHVVDRLHAVEPDLDVRALGAYPVVVPLSRPEDRLPHIGGGNLKVVSPPALVVEVSVGIRAQVRLVARDLEASRNALRPELDPAVNEAAEALDLVLQAQVKVPEFLLGRQELVVRLPPVERTGNDRAVLDPPVGGVSLPPLRDR